MHRTQILLEKWQYDALKARAERAGRSLSDFVREAVSAYLGEAGVATDAPSGLDAVAGIGSDREATGRTHDRFLYNPRKGRRR
jgi:hypothetical protein